MIALLRNLVIMCDIDFHLYISVRHIILNLSEVVRISVSLVCYMGSMVNTSNWCQAFIPISLHTRTVNIPLQMHLQTGSHEAFVVSSPLTGFRRAGYTAS